MQQAGDASSTFVLAMGNNSDGQLGCGIAEDDDDKVRSRVWSWGSGTWDDRGNVLGRS